jgi:L-ascorbate metabolism protein UlaG (beta-lactamase superfamily)
MEAKIAAKPLVHDTLKGKLDMKWYGHAGFKLSFMDEKEIQRAVYIDIWIDNKDCPEEEKKECPNDADLVLVTHG